MDAEPPVWGQSQAPIEPPFHPTSSSLRPADDIAPCRQQAVPALLKVGSQFANELLEGLSPATEKYVLNKIMCPLGLMRTSCASPAARYTLCCRR